MKKRMMFAVAGVALACALGWAAHANAQDKGYWRAASTETTKMTGDIAIADMKLTINFATFPLAAIRRLKPVEVSSVFDADVNAGINGDLYRLRIPANQRIVRRNTLCDGEDTQWMATYVTGRTLRVAFFSGDDMPVFTFGAMQNSTALCGTYTYSR
jgi:hypothetical protein